MKVIKAYRYALDPTPVQAEAFGSHCGGKRFAFNHMLGVVRANLDQREAERTYGLAEADLTPYVNWSAYGLRKSWNARKEAATGRGDGTSWWAENSKEVYAAGCADLAMALANWQASKRGKRAGAKMGFPKREKRHSRLSCRFTTGTIRLEPDRRHLTLPRIGAVRTCENTRKLDRHLKRGTGRVRSATLTHRRRRLRPDPPPARIQDRLERRHPGRGRPVAAVL
ncbi:helix-turn-helix domain-containing protein, partial [Glycomyces xiaoerkulensis]|uniref:helix-turn-helix domain-containing protein n=1 Tax=Glycomyces xiaoerkulensis TaxID=2038139 RepID=UPI0018E41382